MLVAFEFQHVYPNYHPVRTTSLQSISCLSFECRKVLLHFLGYFSISNHSLIATGIFENVEDFSFDSFRIKFQNNWTGWICLQRNCPRYKTTVLMRPHEAKVIENYGGLSERDSTVVGVRFKHNRTCSKHNWKWNSFVHFWTLVTCWATNKLQTSFVTKLPHHFVPYFNHTLV